MKSYLSALSLLAVGAVSYQSAQAADVTFNFLVNSSGADLYACDAGIWEPQGPPHLFYNRPTGAQSNLQARVGTYNNGNPILSWTDILVQGNTQLPVLGVPAFHTAAYPAGYPALTPVITRLNTVLANQDYAGGGTSAGELTFNLASDVYGARYFVDFCFRGSQVPYATGSYDYQIADYVTAADIPSGNYLANSQLEVQGKLVCDKRTSPTAENWASTQIIDLFSLGAVGLDGVPLPQTITTAANSFSGSGQSVFGSPASLTLTNAPAKYCVIRYIFRELATSQRVWDINSAEFTINLSVNNNAYTAP
jgi:hypothetical protein